MAAQPQREPRVAAIARRLGMVVELGPDVVVAGEREPSVTIYCRSNEEALELLNACAEDDAITQTRTRALAARLAVNSPTEESYARAVHAMVRDTIVYNEDPDQVFRSPDVTLRLAMGNCVNSARLIAALCLAAGAQARIVPIRKEGRIVHACAQIAYGGRWHWAEATIAARFDEEPIAAAVRLGVVREDLAGAFDDHDGVSPTVGGLVRFFCLS